MQIYAVSLTAQRQVSGLGFVTDINVSTAGVVCADSEDEALGAAIRLSKETFAIDEGYYNHSAMICLVPHQMAERYMQQFSSNVKAP